MLQKANISKFDCNGAGEENANIFGLNFTQEESNIILMPVSWDVTASYKKGTSKGAYIIKKASPQLDFLDAQFAELGLAMPWEFGIYMLKNDLVSNNHEYNLLSKQILNIGGNIGDDIALNNILCKINKESDNLNNNVKKQAEQLLSNNKIVGIIGGEHSVPFGLIETYAEKYTNLGVLHLDAHADLRCAYEGFNYSHASIMYNIITKIPQIKKLVQVGIRDLCDFEYKFIKNNVKIKTWFDYKIFELLYKGELFANIVKNIINELPENVYISFDIDILQTYLCPNTGTPVPGGFNFNQISYLLKELAISGRKIVGFDLSEVTPALNNDDEYDGNIGARILYKLCAATLFSHGAKN